MKIRIRQAVTEDIPVLRGLIDASVRRLQTRDYTPSQIESALATVYGVDTQLIADGTYLVAEAETGADAASLIVGCGGWSKRKTLYGGDQYRSRDASYLDPESEPAKIRAFFIHPDHARKGIARAILNECEKEARAEGFRALELMATLPGIEFYKSVGFKETGNFDLELTERVKLELVPMRKELL